MRTSIGAERSPALLPLALAALLLTGCETPLAPGGEEIVEVALNPPSFSMAVGEVIRLDVLPRNAIGYPLVTAPPLWASSNPAVAEVDAAGLVHGRGEGTARITATLDGVTGTAEATITPVPPSEWREHVCFVASGGRAWCWGRGGNGELGNGARASSPLPVAVALDDPFVAVAAGASHSCGLTDSGSVHCWGRGAEGQLGNGGTEGSAVPVEVRGDPAGYRSVAAGGMHACALSVTGALECWGSGAFGQLGNGANASVSTPVAPVGGIHFDRVSAGARHTCALTPEGRAYCWGDNGQGQLGDGTTEQRNAPVPVLTGLRFSAISAGARHSCAVAIDGTAWCWGDNRQAQLGNGTLQSSPVPQDVRSAPGFRLRDIAAGSTHTCGIDAAGVAYCWGAGQFGQLGNGGQNLVGNPAQVGVALFDALVVGTAHGCGLSLGGTVLCWGVNAFGQLGTGDFTDRDVPTPVETELRFGRGGG